MSIYNYKSPKFKTFIISLLEKCRLKPTLIQDLLTSKNDNFSGLELYSHAFTHKSIHPENNYEYYEWMGDSTANNCVCWYLTTRFPQLKKPKAVKILARLKINLGSKKTFYELSQKLGFWDYISAGEEQIKRNGEFTTIIVKQVKKKDLLEDTLEAFIGVTQTLIDTHLKEGAGFRFCYNFIKRLYDETDISLAYTDLYDAKTRLKEMFDEWTTEESAIRFWREGMGASKKVPQNLEDRPEDRPLGNKKWNKNNIRATYISQDERGEELEYGFWNIEVFYKGVEDITRKERATEILLGRGKAPKKDRAEQIACQVAISFLNKDKTIKYKSDAGIKTYTLKGLFKTTDPIYEEINS
jgi:dsRNA-specific ribonuclease